MSLFAVAISWLRFRPLCPHHTAVKAWLLACTYVTSRPPPPRGPAALRIVVTKICCTHTIHSNFIEASRNHNRPTKKNVLRYLLSWNHSSTNNESYFSNIVKKYSKYWLKKCLRRKGKPNVTIMSIKKFRRAWNWKTNVSEKEFDWLIPGRISDYDIYIFRNKYLIKFKSSPPSQREKPKCVSCPSLFGIVWVCVSVCLSVSLSVQSSHVFWTKIQLLNSHVLYSMWRY